MSSIINTNLKNYSLNKRYKRREIKINDQLINKTINKKKLITTTENLILFKKDFVYNKFWMPEKPLQKERIQWPGLFK